MITIDVKLTSFNKTIKAWRYDTCQKIEFINTKGLVHPQIHFDLPNGSAEIRTATLNGSTVTCAVPNAVFEGLAFGAYVVEADDTSSTTIYAAIITLRNRNKPDGTVTEDQQAAINTLIAQYEALNSAYQESKTAAELAATNAKTSETNAATSETNSKSSETSSKTSETNSKTSENNAKTSENNAKTSETNAKTSEDTAKNSENAAKLSETNAKTSEDNAKASEDAAKASETASHESEDEAAGYAAQALNNMLNGISTHNSDAAAHSSIQADLRTIEAIARGRATSLVFNTYSQLTAWVAGTYTRPDGITVNDIIVGDNLYILDTHVKDYWWDGTQIRVLESENPDLADYYLKTQVDALMPIRLSRTEYDALVAAGTVQADRDYDVYEV